MKLADLDIKNETGSIWVEQEGQEIIIYFEAEVHPTLPPNHIRFNPTETMKFAKWLTSVIIGTEISDGLDKAISDELANRPKDIMK